MRGFTVGVFLFCVTTPLLAGQAVFHRPLHAHRLHMAPAARSRQAAERGATAAIVVDTTLAPEELIGERMFFETRFAQFFMAHYDGNVNHPLQQGDSVAATVSNPQAGVPYPGPFAGKSINCRSCHFVDEFGGLIGGGNRAYSDFVAHSPIPDRGDGHSTTPRSALSMVDSLIPRSTGPFLHGDGEFVKETTLVKSTMTGRNFGWLPTEYESAIAHIAKVIREDDGNDELGQAYGGSYSKILLGTAPDIPFTFSLPGNYRLDVQHASDEEVVDAVAKLIAAYLDGLRFSKDDAGAYNGSPYDLFLARNRLPQAPLLGESNEEYSQRLLNEINLLTSPKYISDVDGHFTYHPQNFAFGPMELQGLKLFLKQSVASPKVAELRRPPVFFPALLPCGAFVLIGAASWRKKRVVGISVVGIVCSLLLACGAGSTSKGQQGATAPDTVVEHTGNCVSCHAAPTFTDFRFHNTGATQDEYDAVHGSGSFMVLTIPSYSERQANQDEYLPATPQHPNGSGVFREPASEADARLTDLGMWNVYANSDYPEPQQPMQKLMCGTSTCDPGQVLPQTIARFKTPTLRDLGDSQPYLHTGKEQTLEDVLAFYVRMSKLARQDQLRNGDQAIAGISIDDQDSAAIVAFLRSLNEDYD